MSVDRHIKKFVALVLTAAAIVLAAQIAVDRVAAGASSQPTGTAHNGGNAVPAILPQARAADLAALEAGGAFSMNPPAHGSYSNAEMNAYATARR